MAGAHHGHHVLASESAKSGALPNRLRAHWKGEDRCGRPELLRIRSVRCSANSSPDSLVGLFGELAVLHQVFAGSRLLIRVPVCYGTKSTLHVSVDDLEAVNVGSVDPAESVLLVSEYSNIRVD